MPLTQAALEAVNASTTDQAFFVLLTFTSPVTGLQTRVVNNNEAVESNGEIFEPYPFSITLPVEAADQAPAARLTIDNVDRDITRWVRETVDPPEVRIEIVLSGTPDVIERALDFLMLTGVTYDATKVQGTLQLHDFMNQPAIDSIYAGTEFPDLVWA